MTRDRSDFGESIGACALHNNFGKQVLWPFRLINPIPSAPHIIPWTYDLIRERQNRLDRLDRHTQSLILSILKKVGIEKRGLLALEHLHIFRDRNPHVIVMAKDRTTVIGPQFIPKLGRVGRAGVDEPLRIIIQRNLDWDKYLDVKMAVATHIDNVGSSRL